MYPGASLWLLLPSVLLALIPCRAADPGSWGDWVILDEAEPGTSILLRRITPKSVFVAPTFICSEGYRQDALGRCIKHVKVNQAEQWKFYLDRLNSMYAPASSSKKPQKEAGPFHISLPIGADNSREDVVVKKRLPPVIRDQVVNVESTVKSTTQPPTTTQQPATTTTYPPPTTMPTTATTVQESTTPEPTETTSTEREYNSLPEVTTEPRRKYETTEYDEAGEMLGDQPVSPESSTPKTPSQLTDKPFVIIVTSEPAVETENSALEPVTATTEREVEEVTSESPVATELTTEPTSRYTTDSTEYDERFSEVSETPRVTTPSARPPCDPRAVDYEDCEPADTELVTHKRVVTFPSSAPLLEPHTRVRFPSRKSQQSQPVRFPERSHPQDDRPSLWYPSWRVASHPAIRGWPPPDSDDRADTLHKQYPPYPNPALSWSHSPSHSRTWNRRYFLGD